MRQAFEIADKELIDEVLKDVEYGTLAICDNNKPYSVPVNFVKIDDEFYFHGSKKGRKMDILKNNQYASFSVVEPYSMIQSYFSSKEQLACPATQFFKSIIIDGEIKFIENYDEKVKVLSELMKKLQKEGGYKPLSEEVYQKIITATMIYKLVPSKTKAKFKFGQHLNQERFDRTVEHLKKRGDKKDILSIKLMEKLKQE